MRVKINHNFTPPEGAVQVGLYNGQPVYQETVRVPIKRVRTDAEGKEIWHKGPRGELVRRSTEIVGYEEKVREYQLVALGNNTVQKNDHFRPGADEIAAQEAEAREATRVDEMEAKLAKILAQMEKIGLSEADLLDEKGAAKGRK